jgi:hypothetical protein
MRAISQNKSQSKLRCSELLLVTTYTYFTAHRKVNRVNVTWQGPYRGGTITLAAATLPDLNKLIDEYVGEVDQLSGISHDNQPTSTGDIDYPKVSGALGPSAAIMETLTSPWGRTEPRTEREITEALKINAIHLPQGTISGTLNYLTRQNRLRRLPKGDRFAYTPTAEALVTA